MNNIGVIGGADGETVIMVSGSIAPPILWIFFGALALMVILYAAFYRRGKGKAVCLALAAVFCVAADQGVKFLVVNTMSLGESEPLLPPLLQLTRVHNYSAAHRTLPGARSTPRLRAQSAETSGRSSCSGARSRRAQRSSAANSRSYPARQRSTKQARSALARPARNSEESA